MPPVQFDKFSINNGLRDWRIVVIDAEQPVSEQVGTVDAKICPAERESINQVGWHAQRQGLVDASLAGKRSILKLTKS